MRYSQVEIGCFAQDILMINLLSEITELLRKQEHCSCLSFEFRQNLLDKNTLIPYLESQGKEVQYLEDGDAKITDSADIVIVMRQKLFDEDFYKIKIQKNI